VGGQHHQNQHNGVHQHPIVRELPQGLRQHIQDNCCHDGAPDVAQTAQHHIHQHQNGGVEVELYGSDIGVVQAEQGTGGTCQGGRGDEGNQLVLGDVDAYALGGDPVVPDGHDSPAGPAADQIQHHHQGNHHQ
ncbi:hypothetical protein LEFCBN_LEFCBN_13275, partial [Dysosmobacter welbionis]